MVGTFNQSLQCTQDVFVGFQAPLPPVSSATTCVMSEGMPCNDPLRGSAILKLMLEGAHINISNTGCIGQPFDAQIVLVEGEL